MAAPGSGGPLTGVALLWTFLKLPLFRERAVRMARDAIAEQGGQTFGVVTRVARQLGVGT